MCIPWMFKLSERGWEHILWGGEWEVMCAFMLCLCRVCACKEIWGTERWKAGTQREAGRDESENLLQWCTNIILRYFPALSPPCSYSLCCIYHVSIFVYCMLKVSRCVIVEELFICQKYAPHRKFRPSPAYSCTVGGPHQTVPLFANLKLVDLKQQICLILWWQFIVSASPPSTALL